MHYLERSIIRHFAQKLDVNNLTVLENLNQQEIN